MSFFNVIYEFVFSFDLISFQCTMENSKNIPSEVEQHVVQADDYDNNPHIECNENPIAQNSNSQNYRVQNVICFSTIGLCNSFGWTVMLSATYDIVKGLDGVSVWIVHLDHIISYKNSNEQYFHAEQSIHWASVFKPFARMHENFAGHITIGQCSPRAYHKNYFAISPILCKVCIIIRVIHFIPFNYSFSLHFLTVLDQFMQCKHDSVMCSFDGIICYGCISSI